MKVLIISDSPQANTGYGKLTKTWAKYLIKQGNEVLVMGGVSPQAQIPFQEHDYEGIRLWQMPGYGHQEHIRGLLTNEKPDVILANADPRFFDYLFKMDNEIRSQCPLVFYHLWDDAPFPDFNMTAYVSCNRIICGSKFTYDLMKSHAELVARNFLSYVPIGVNTNTYKPNSTEEKATFRKEFDEFTNNKFIKAKFIVGAVGRNAERKQLLTILESFTKWAEGKDDVLLFVHAPGVDQGNALGYAIKMRYDTGKIIYSQAAPHTQPDELINKFYNFFDVLVNRSNAEGFGLPIAEAMAAGIPCIAVDNAGPQNLISPETGWLLESDCSPLFGNMVTPYIQTRYVTDKKFEDALDLAYRDTAAREEKASKCRAFIKANYDEKQMVKGIERELQKAIQDFKPYPEYTITTWPETRSGVKMHQVLTEVE